MVNKNFLLISILCLLTLLAAMNSVIFNVAIPNISNDLALTSSQVSWISIGYTSITAVGSLAYGKLSIKYPIRRLLNIGILLFFIGSLIGFLGSHFYLLIILARLIQASGSSSFVILSMLTINKYIPIKLKGVSLSLLSISIALALGVGPLLGGIITNRTSWNYLFLIMLISIFLPLFINIVMPNEVNSSFSSFDYAGLVLTFILIITIMLSINNNYLLIIISLMIGTVLINYSKRKSNPFIDLSIFKNRLFRIFILMGFLLNACHLAVLFIIPILLSIKFHISPQEIGFLFFGGSISGIFSSLYSKKYIVQKKFFFVLILSLCTILVGTASLAILSEYRIYLTGISFILICIGYSPIQIGLNSLVSQELAEHNSSNVLGTYNMFNFIGMACGPALISKVSIAFNNYSVIFLVCLALACFNLLCLFFIKKKI
ncbi:MFS transporter [Lactococcus lactis]|uniref:MFS transporter n=1 Tax=Lactococcus lactis TaxID=1358 RepID=UPI0024A947AD|nr:MFS transporter [Lactococcus lactis]